MTVAAEFRYKIWSRYLQKWLSYDIKRVKNRHFSSISGRSRDFLFLPILTLQKLF